VKHGVIEFLPNVEALDSRGGSRTSPERSSLPASLYLPILPCNQEVENSEKSVSAVRVGGVFAICRQFRDYGMMRRQVTYRIGRTGVARK